MPTYDQAIPSDESSIRSGTVSIANGGTTSDAFDMGGGRLSALHIPSTFQGTTITFLSARTPTDTYRAVYDDAGNAVSLTVAASRVVGIDAAAGKIAGLRFIKLVAGSAQNADIDIGISSK